jgi:ABC-2 type transport system permease protein
VRGMLLIAQRDLGTYFNSPWGYVVGAVVLLIDGLFFNAFALTSQARLSFEVLRDFFYFSFGTTVIASILLTMRLIAEERQTGTMVLVDASPLSDWQVIGGKFLSAFGFLALLTGMTAFMPLLIFVNGKVSVGHILCGYLGLLLVGAATLSIGTFTSTLTRSQLVSGVLATVLIVFLLITWLLARVADPPLKEVLSYMSFFDRHFRRSFMEGRIELKSVVYYLTITFSFLTLATRSIAPRRWK